MYYDTNEVAKLLGYTIETVRRKIRRGEISAIKVRDKHKVPASEVKRYLLSIVKADVSDEEKLNIVNNIINGNR